MSWTRKVCRLETWGTQLGQKYYETVFWTFINSFNFAIFLFASFIASKLEKKYFSIKLRVIKIKSYLKKAFDSSYIVYLLLNSSLQKKNCRSVISKQVAKERFTQRYTRHNNHKPKFYHPYFHWYFYQNTSVCMHWTGLKWILYIIWALNQHVKLKNQRHLLKKLDRWEQG